MQIILPKNFTIMSRQGQPRRRLIADRNSSGKSFCLGARRQDFDCNDQFHVFKYRTLEASLPKLFCWVA